MEQIMEVLKTMQEGMNESHKEMVAKIKLKFSREMNVSVG
jgi:hypothetical protein